jgi:beta-galactosidase/beta-glucuronidase
MNAAELAQAMYDAKREIDAAFLEYDRAIREDAEADKQAKIAHASAYLASSGTAGERTAWADKGSVDERYKARLAEGLKRSAAQAVESKRQWLSALQSLASLTKAEAQLAKWEPSEVAS